MQLLYTIGIVLYGFSIRIASLFNNKAKKWANGRKDWQIQLSDFKRLDAPLYWFHCASLGEFEQGRPIIEALKREKNCQIVVSFFSPSGYEVRKNYELADYVFYLPIDQVSNAKILINYLKPDQVFFVKYEFWANLIEQLKTNHIPVYLVSGIFRKDQAFFKWYGPFFRNVLANFEAIFVQDVSSKLLLDSIGVESVVSGDTRYDRVMQNSSNAQKINLVDNFCNNEKVLLVGSSWAEDDEVLMPLINDPTFTSKVIIAPHEINENRIRTIEKHLNKKTLRYSDYTGEKDVDVLIIDNIGLLMHLYQYADIAYVGGGFKTGLHNILEPASFGVPVIFGPNHKKFPEAELFIENGIGFEISHVDQLKETYYRLKTGTVSESILSFMNFQTGATDMVLKHCNV